MNTKGKRLAAILGISSIVLATGVGVYAAQNESPFEGAMNRERPQMMVGLFESGEMRKPRVQISDLVSNLSDSEKAKFEEIGKQLHEGKESLFENLKATSNEEEKKELIEKWNSQAEKLKDEVKEILPEDSNIDKMFEKEDLGNKLHGGNSEIMRGGKGDRFGFAFIDEDSLTDTQKEEIEKLQEERDEAIKKINDEFFDKLEKYISEEKLESYENFVENHENIQGNKKGLHEKGEFGVRGDKGNKVAPTNLDQTN